MLVFEQASSQPASQSKQPEHFIQARHPSIPLAHPCIHPFVVLRPQE